MPLSSFVGRDWQDWEDTVIPRRFSPVFVVLSYLISFMGSWTTLELMDRQTSLKGWYNWSVMIAASITMGGMAVWCMHFIGLRAIILLHGEVELQIMFSPSFTALSFFLPIVIILGAFVATGPSDKLRYDRLVLGGLLAGIGICGMHYLGDAGIQNYDLFYDIPYVIGSVLVAFVASVLALGSFAMLHHQWRSAWWKRCLCAFTWSCAASGMHWLASVGTKYQLKIDILATSIAIGARNATTVLVLILGINDTFNIYHSTYLWMFRTSRNWDSIVDLVPLMRNHLSHSGLRHRFGAETDYMNDQGTPIKDYPMVFRELFCVAAADLADDLNQHIEKLGILYDEIIPTDQKPKPNRFKPYERATSSVDLERDGIELEALGKGQLLFLVRTVGKRDAYHLQGAGYRFAEPNMIIPNLAAVLRIRRIDLTRYLDIMCKYADKEEILEPGVHLGLFACRASLSTGGFEVLARKDARNLLPTMQLTIKSLENWQSEYIQTLDAEDASTCLKRLSKTSKGRKGDPKEMVFAKQIQSTLEALKHEIGDASFFNDARLIAKATQVPCRGPTQRSRPRLATLISFRLVAALGSRPPGKKLDYIPLALFKTQQKVYRNARDHSIFARQTYRDFASILDLSETLSEATSFTGTAPVTPVDEDRHRSPDLFIQSITERLLHADKFGVGTKLGFFKSNHQKGNAMSPDEGHHKGGIMVSRGVSVVTENVEDITDEIVTELVSRRKSAYKDIGDIPGFKLAQVTKASKENDEEMAFVDELFNITIKLR